MRRQGPPRAPPAGALRAPLPSLSLFPARLGAHATYPVRRRGASAGIPGARGDSGSLGPCVCAVRDRHRARRETGVSQCPVLRMVPGKLERLSVVGRRVRSVGGALALVRAALAFTLVSGSEKEELASFRMRNLEAIGNHLLEKQSSSPTSGKIFSLSCGIRVSSPRA